MINVYHLNIWPCEMEPITNLYILYTKYYKLVVFIVGVIFILSSACSHCSDLTVASQSTDLIATKRIIGEPR